MLDFRNNFGQLQLFDFPAIKMEVFFCMLHSEKVEDENFRSTSNDDFWVFSGCLKYKALIKSLIKS